MAAADAVVVPAFRTECRASSAATGSASLRTRQRGAPGPYVRLPRTRPNLGLDGRGDFIGVLHSHLPVAIARDMGLELDHQGIPEIPAPGGRPALSLSGPLPELV